MSISIRKRKAVHLLAIPCVALLSACSDPPPEFKYVQLVSKTIDAHPDTNGSVYFDVDLQSDPVLVLMTYDDSSEGDRTPPALYWIKGETVYAGNELTQNYSPGIPFLDQRTPEGIRLEHE